MTEKEKKRKKKEKKRERERKEERKKRWGEGGKLHRTAKAQCRGRGL